MPNPLITTRIFHISAPKTSPILIFIPGNPGFIEYYTRYLKLLASTGFEILGISHAGFVQGEEEVYTLQDQVDHKVSIIRQFVSKERDVYIVGHSMGSWIMQRIVDQTPDLKYKFIGFIMPTIIDIHKSEKGSSLYSLVLYTPWFVKLTSYLTKLIRLLPNRITDKLIDYTMTTDFKNAKSITKEFIKDSNLVYQSLALASEEMLVIQSDWEYHNRWLINNEHVYKWFFFANKDHWINDETLSDIENSLKLIDNVSLMKHDYIKHNFCINQSDEFARITINELSLL